MFSQDLILIDTETTGRSTRSGYEAIQLAAVRLDKTTLVEKASFKSLIRPLNPGHVEPMAMKIHGIPMETLLQAPEHKEVVDGFASALFSPSELADGAKGIMLAAHNAVFDWDFFTQILERAGKSRDMLGYHIFDVWAVAVDRCALLGVVPPGGKYSLQNLAEMFHIARPETHDALEDVRVTAEIFRRLTELMQERLRGGRDMDREKSGIGRRLG